MAAPAGRDVPTVAGVVQLPPATQPAFPVNGENAAYIGFGSLIVALGIGWLRRRLSRDGNQIMQDRADGVTTKMLLEVNKALTVENERLTAEAREAWAKTNGDASVIGRLEAENGYLKERLGAAQDTINLIRRGVQEVGQKVDSVQTNLNETNRVIDSGMAPLETLTIQPPRKK